MQLIQINARVEFGFTRTECACRKCQKHCRQIPGYLIPDDVERISRHLGDADPREFADRYLLASPGATVMSADGHIIQISTLVPRRQENGSCIFLTADGWCSIHAVAPFGCAFFHCSQSQAEANRRSSRGLQEIARHWIEKTTSSYTMLWRRLYQAGRRAIPPHLARPHMPPDEQSGTTL